MKQRRALLPADWPGSDREAWNRAMAPSKGLFDEEGGAAERLREPTIVNYASVYGLWLEFLARSGFLMPGESPEQRPTADRLNAFCADQRSRGNRPRTMESRLVSLYGALRLMAPGAELTFIIRPGGVPLRQVFRAVPKPFVPHDVSDIMPHVRRLHARGLAGIGYAGGATALRDAALFALLLSRAPRIRSIAAMRLGQITELGDGCLHVDFPALHTKANRRIAYPLDAEVSRIIRDYLTQGRRMFPGAAGCGDLWLGTKGGPLSLRGLAAIVECRTKAWLGRASGPHMARKWLRSSAARRSPGAASDAAEVLGHGPAVSVRHYAEAHGLHAAMRYGDRIGKLRRRTAAWADRILADSENPGLNGDEEPSA